jgi:hypothetical protein
LADDGVSDWESGISCLQLTIPKKNASVKASGFFIKEYGTKKGIPSQNGKKKGDPIILKSSCGLDNRNLTH